MATKTASTTVNDSFYDQDADDSGEWAPLVEDEGDRLVLQEGKPFIGTFVGSREVQVMNEDTGTPETVTLCMFRDKAGHRWNMWANYRLMQAIENGMHPGDTVKLVTEGKADLGAGRTMNRLSVYVKR